MGLFGILLRSLHPASPSLGLVGRHNVQEVIPRLLIDKFIFNHSFIIPGFISVITSCVVGTLLAQVLL